MVTQSDQTDGSMGAMQTLPDGMVLHTYRIERTLGQGGFGVTYLAHDLEEDCKVVIKENLPTAFAHRDSTSLFVHPMGDGELKENFEWALERFIDEARTIASLNHPNIVQVKRAFRMLGTAFYVMPWVGGNELGKIAPSPDQITEEWLRPILLLLLDALSYLHSNNLQHRDIKPANVLIDSQGTPTLIDFGAARALVSEHSATAIESAGYTPVEQLQAHSKKGPWTDLYALGATCYKLITGERPPRSIDRLGKNDPYRPLLNEPQLLSRFSVSFLSAIDKALSLWMEDRWQSAEEWIKELSTEAPPCVPPAPVRPRMEVMTAPGGDAPSAGSPSRGKRRPQKKRRVWVPLVLLIALAGGAVFVGKDAFTPPTSATSKPARPKRTPATDQNIKKAKALIRDVLARQGTELLPTDSVLTTIRQTIQRTPHIMEELGKLAEDNNAEAQYVYALACTCGGYQTPQKAHSYLLRAAEAGLRPAQTLLAHNFDEGINTAPDAQQAFIWHLRAADSGCAISQNEVAMRYENGTGTYANPEKAFAYYRKAADQKLARACCNLGVCYEKGIGTAIDDYEAFKWYDIAADQNYPRAICNQGVCFDYGKGTREDKSRAVACYQLAAKLGHAPAQYNLAICYLHGIGVPTNESEAINWLRCSADQGYKPAQDKLRDQNR